MSDLQYDIHLILKDLTNVVSRINKDNKELLEMIQALTKRVRVLERNQLNITIQNKN